MTVDVEPIGHFRVGLNVLTCHGFGQESRWRPGERLAGVFEEACDRMRAAGTGAKLAVDSPDMRLTYEQLDACANQLGRYLLARGVRAGDRIGLLFDRPAYAYIGMLAVLKVNAAYVPLDPVFPNDRLAYVAEDANLGFVLTVAAHRNRIGGVTTVCLDEEGAQIAERPSHRITSRESGEPVDDLCYIIYTSGSTGKPKGVVIRHAAICNFVRVAADVYGVQASDRMYQGLTIAFDFSIEEIWVAWLSGATLVPKPPGASLVGADLLDFLRAQGVTALCCVPTVLATLDGDIPGLRFLLVSGEACPDDLVRRWHRPDRRFLNVYGPTEATVTATWAIVDPHRPVTIGVPLPTYSVVILDPESPRALPVGELGEIGIAGIGLADGYLNRPDLTDRAFVPDFVGIPRNPSRRIYRTGDLGRITPSGEIEYHGRTDTQVKIRGYRIELEEIESAILQIPEVTQAVVTTYQPEPDVTELVAYCCLAAHATDTDSRTIQQRVRSLVPAYMVPAYFERLDCIPMTPAGKADRKNLPVPSGQRVLAGTGDYAAPTTALETDLAEILALVLRVERISVESHIFDDLGANSLLLARFCARVRERDDLPPVSQKDLYLNPTIRQLAAALRAGAPGENRRRLRPAHQASAVQYYSCGFLQILTFLVYACGLGAISEAGLTWIDRTGGLGVRYLHAVEAGVIGFALLSITPILAKWLLVGRWKPTEFDVWGPQYFRFWLVRTMTRLNPMTLFAGSPLYGWYLRALGAKIGKGAVILSRNMPACPDLLTVGAGAVIRKDSHFATYRAQAGRIQTGPVTVGAQAFVGEMSVLEIGSRIGDRGQLAHASSLQTGQVIPPGESWHGSPAQPASVSYLRLRPLKIGAFRRVIFCAIQLTVLFLITLPVAILLFELLGSVYRPVPDDFSSPEFYLGESVTSLLVFAAGLTGELIIVRTVPRILHELLREGRTYPLYGFHHTIQRMITRMGNVRLLTYLFGDSSYIVHYLRGIGYDLSKVEQSGSNFGVEVKHESPFLSRIGTGTMVSDGLSLLNAEFSRTSFRLRRTVVGERNFLGNNIAFPPGAKVGANCLLATKVLVPIDGEVRENVGLLGSPPFEIPRSVQRDAKLPHLKTRRSRRLGLSAKNQHNTVTLLVYLFVQWFQFFGIVLIESFFGSLNARFGLFAVAAGLVSSLIFSVLFLVFAERATQWRHPLRPRFCSIYDRAFWRHERFWKLSAGRYLALFNGTPIKNAIWRLLGVRMGKRVFDDGCAMPEKSLVTVGDFCSLNAGSTIQGHSLEDGAFKSGRITIGAGSTIGTSAFIHYGTVLGSGTLVDADAFVMKGTETEPGSRWRGNPATEFFPEDIRSHR